MPLAPGTIFGPYEILAPLGAGGMGEVYRARDTRLARDVALKILPPEFARDPSRRQRFAQEARAVAALNHPNIVAVYDVGAQGDIAYIVTELVDGEPLRAAGSGCARRSISPCRSPAAWPRRTPPVSCIATSSPTTSWSRARDGRPPGPRSSISAWPNSNLPTPRAAAATETLTEPGMVMGTIGYMSPEQVKGGARRSPLRHLQLRAHSVRAAGREARLPGRLPRSKP